VYELRSGLGVCLAGDNADGSGGTAGLVIKRPDDDGLPRRYASRGHLPAQVQPQERQEKEEEGGVRFGLGLGLRGRVLPRAK